MEESLTELRVLLAGGVDTDDEEREELALDLARELLEADADGVEILRDGTAPPGSKAVDGLAVGLVVSVVPTVVSQMLVILRSWSTQRQRPCVLRLAGPSGAVVEIPNVPLAELEGVIAQWKLSDGGPTPVTD